MQQVQQQERLENCMCKGSQVMYAVQQHVQQQIQHAELGSQHIPRPSGPCLDLGRARRRTKNSHFSSKASQDAGFNNPEAQMLEGRSFKSFQGHKRICSGCHHGSLGLLPKPRTVRGLTLLLVPLAECKQKEIGMIGMRGNPPWPQRFYEIFTELCRSKAWTPWYPGAKLRFGLN